MEFGAVVRTRVRTSSTKQKTDGSALLGKRFSNSMTRRYSQGLDSLAQLGRVPTSFDDMLKGRPSRMTVSLGLPASRVGLWERLRLS